MGQSKQSVKPVPIFLRENSKTKGHKVHMGISSGLKHAFMAFSKNNGGKFPKQNYYIIICKYGQVKYNFHFWYRYRIQHVAAMITMPSTSTI